MLFWLLDKLEYNVKKESEKVCCKKVGGERNEYTKMKKHKSTLIAQSLT